MIKEAADKTAESTGETFVFKKFFPYLADGSFLSLHETDGEIDSFIRNFPGWNMIGTIPFKDIRKLNIPSINMGVYGKDGINGQNESINRTHFMYCLSSYSKPPFIFCKATG